MTGWTLLLRHHLRRDRWMYVPWLVGVVVLFWSQGVSVVGLYGSQAELDKAAAASEDNAAFIAMAGPARALDTVGGQVFWQASAFGAIVVGLMSMFLIGRHTRAEEESGRDELVRSGAVGRHAPLTAALAVAVLANLVIGVAVALSLTSVRGDVPLEGLPLPAADNWAVGLGLAACGWVFAATALIAAQVTQSTRGMYGIAGAVLGLAFALRAVGDVSGGALSWASPIGWYQSMRAYDDLRWWPLALLVVAAAAAGVAAYALFGRRDIGSGLWAARPGPAIAERGLRSGVGLAWRLQRGTIIGWTAGLVLTGLAYGSIGNSVEDLLGDSDIAQTLGGDVTDNLVDGFYATSIVMLALIACGFAISSALRPRGEEEAGHAEVLLATALSRRDWLLGHLLMTVGGTVVVVAAAGFSMGGAYALTTGDGGAVLRLGLASLTVIPAVLVLAGVAVLLYGLGPRLVVLAWLPLVLAVVVLMLSEALRLPAWVQDLSPFHHLALAPAESVAWAPVLLLAVLAAALGVAGQVTLSRRSIG